MAKVTICMQGTVAEIINTDDKQSVSIACRKKNIVFSFDHGFELGLGKELIISGTVELDDLSITDINKEKQHLK